jgi:hypothetical protein
MSLAHEITPMFREKLIINPIHRNRHVPAAIHISVKLTMVVDQKAFFVSTSNRQQEFS